MLVPIFIESIPIGKQVFIEQGIQSWFILIQNILIISTIFTFQMFHKTIHKFNGMTRSREIYTSTV